MKRKRLLTLLVLLLTVVTGANAVVQAGFTVARQAYGGVDAAKAPSMDWKVGDLLYVYGASATTHEQVLMGTLAATTAGPESFMAGTLDFTETGTEVPMTLTLSNLPQPMDYTVVDGTLAGLSQTNYAMATAIATAVDATAGTVTLDGTPTLVPQQALVKVTLQDSDGEPLVPNYLECTLLSQIDLSNQYRLINLWHHKMPFDGAGDWTYGGATFENGVITLPKEGGCASGWKTELWNEDLTKYSGVIVMFDEPLNVACTFTVAYMEEGYPDLLYYNFGVSAGSSFAWAGIPTWANQICGIYFVLDGPTEEDVIIKPKDFYLNYIGDYGMYPQSNELYLPLLGMEPNSKLSFEAWTNSGKRYAFSADGVTFTEGDYCEQAFKLDNVVTLTLDPEPRDRVSVIVDDKQLEDNNYFGVKPGKTVKITANPGIRLKKVEVKKTNNWE